MPMITYVVVAILALGLLGWEIRRAGGAYLTFRGQRVITCPGTGQPAGIVLAAGHIAWTAAFGQPGLRIRDCSRRVRREDCGQACLGQIRAAPEESLVRTILRKWYSGKSCSCCGGPLKGRREPCVLSPDLRMIEWKDIRPEKVPQVLATHSPVCWNCLVAETHIW